MYDYTIIGAGPTGLAIAYILSQYNKTILIIDREETIGGCHRVKRVNNYFTEHGPRVYSDSYVNTIHLLKFMGIDFYDYFTKYNFSTGSVIMDNIKKFTFKEVLLLGYQFMKLQINPNSLKNVTCLDFMKNNNFNQQSLTVIDRICRLISGTDASKYSLYGFLQIVNQLALHEMYQPNKPNDIGLFKIMKEKLLNTNKITFLTGNVVKLINYNNNNNKIQYIILHNNYHNKTNKYQKIHVNNCILAIPPMNLLEILDNSNLLNDKSINSINSITSITSIPNNKLIDWAINNNYNLYITIVFHWKDKIMLPKIHSVSSVDINDWGIEFVVLSDYMSFDLEQSKTVISTSISITDQKSSYINKLPNECNEEELIKETFRQLKTILPNLPNPTKSIMNPNIKKINGKWTENDTAYVRSVATTVTDVTTATAATDVTTVTTVTTVDSSYIDFKSPKYSNLYFAGSHNGETNIVFTSIESAIVNAIKLCHILVDDSKQKYKLKSGRTITNIIVLILIIIFIVCLILFIKY